MAIWRTFTELDLSEAKKSRFDSLHDCFTRELKPGARTVDPGPDRAREPLRRDRGRLRYGARHAGVPGQGLPVRDRRTVRRCGGTNRFRGGSYVTLRLTSSMYHRFHAPHDARIEQVDYLSGDTWNVNPIALARVERLFCRNERAVIRMRLDSGGHAVALVAVAAILVASIRLHCLDVLLHLRYRGPHRLPCDAPVAKGEELGWFEHGSTIIVFAPEGFALAPGIEPGASIRMGQALMRLPASGA